MAAKRPREGLSEAESVTRWANHVAMDSEELLKLFRNRTREELYQCFLERTAQGKPSLKKEEFDEFFRELTASEDNRIESELLQLAKDTGAALDENFRDLLKGIKRAKLRPSLARLFFENQSIELGRKAYLIVKANEDVQDDEGHDKTKWSGAKIASEISQWFTGQDYSCEALAHNGNFLLDRLYQAADASEVLSMKPDTLMNKFLSKSDHKVGRQLYLHLHPLQDFNEPDVAKWPGSRVAEVCWEFAENNAAVISEWGARTLSNVYGDSPASELLGIKPAELSNLFVAIDESARRVLGRRLYLHLHPIQVWPSNFRLGGHVDEVFGVQDSDETDVAKWCGSRIAEACWEWAEKHSVVFNDSGTRHLSDLYGETTKSDSLETFQKLFIPEFARWIDQPDTKKQSMAVDLYYILHPKAEPDDDLGISHWSRKRMSRHLAEWGDSEKVTLSDSAFKLRGQDLAKMTFDEFLRQLSMDDLNRAKILDCFRKLTGKLYDLSDVQLIRLKEDFEKRYEDPSGVVASFREYARQCVQAFKDTRIRDKFFGPYISCVQSSGTGKTRLMREVAKAERVLYVCLRQGQSGYPLRTEKAAEALFGNLSGCNQTAAVETLRQRLGYCEKAAKKLPDPTSNATSGDFPSELDDGAVWNFENRNDRLEKERPLTILVIDEARELLLKEKEIEGVSLFRLLRRALSAYCANDAHAKIFVVLLDTTSRLHNGSLTLSGDHSASESLEEKLLLLPPYILRGTVDVLFKELPAATTDSTSLAPARSGMNLVQRTGFLNAGRPLVAAASADSSMQLSFLNRKLRGGGTDMTHLGALSMILARIAALINSHNTCASELVSGHMGFLLASSLHRDCILVSYLAEPRLAQAAAMDWTHKNLRKWLLPALEQALISGAVTSGTAGELVAQIIILLAFDAACSQASAENGECVPLKEVIRQLLPAKVDDEEGLLSRAIPDALKDAFAACGQFVKLHHRFDQETIIRLLERHCGAVFSDRQPGVDLMVPIIHTELAVMLFHIKNHVDENGTCAASTNACKEMLPSKAFTEDRFNTKESMEQLDGNCVRIYLQLGAAPGGVKFEEGLQIFGLVSRCLFVEGQDDVEIDLALANLLKASHRLDRFVCQQLAFRNNSDYNLVPYPDSLQALRVKMRFVIDRRCTWADFTCRELAQVCKNNRIAYSGRRKSAMVEALSQAGIDVNDFF